MSHRPSDSAAGAEAWRRVDWRFMLPDPRLGPVWLAPECMAEAPALSAVGVDVVPEPGNAAAAFVDGARCDVDEIERTLPHGTLVRITVVDARPHGSEHGQGWRVAEQLERRGWQLLGRIWAAGGIDTALAYVDLDDSRAVRYFLRMTPRSGIRRRLEVTVRLTLTRFGLSRMLCHEGFVIARTPT